MEIDLIIKILTVVALISFIILAFASVFYLKRMVETLESGREDVSLETSKMTKILEEGKNDLNYKIDLMNKDMSALKAKVVESLEKTDEATIEATELVKLVKNEVNGIGEVVKNRVDNIYNMIEPMGKLISTTQKKIAPPINSTASYISATTKAIRTFTEYFTKNKK